MATPTSTAPSASPSRVQAPAVPRGARVLRSPSLAPRPGMKRHEERERAGGEQQVLQQLRMRREHAEPDDEREQRPRPTARPSRIPQTSTSSVSGKSAQTKSLPSCPGEGSDASCPLIM